MKSVLERIKTGENVSNDELFELSMNLYTPIRKESIYEDLRTHFRKYYNIDEINTEEICKLVAYTHDQSISTKYNTDYQTLNELNNEIKLLRNEIIDREHEEAPFFDDEAISRLEKENKLLKLKNESYYKELIKIWYDTCIERVKKE